MSEPRGWREVIMDRVEEREPKRSPRKSVGLSYPAHYHEVIRAAAESRGMRMGAYARRAMLAFVAYDLDIPFSDLVDGDTDYAKSVGAVGHRRDDKPISGDWEIAALIRGNDG